MGVPKQKHTKSRRDRRRMHLFIKPSALTKCSKCGKAVLPHKVCLNCGFYKGREVVNVLKKLDKKERKLREKEIQSKETGEKKAKPGALAWEELSKK